MVQILWTLNYITVDFNGLLPRLRGMSQSLDLLAQVIPSMQRKSTTDVLEGELKKTLSQFAEVIEWLTSGREKTSNLLCQLEQHRMDLERNELGKDGQ